MDLLHRIEIWGEKHHPKLLDILRIALGFFLFIKGVESLNNMSQLLNLMTGPDLFGSFSILVLSHYIVFAHLLGGILMILGILTRFACLIQIPVMIGAVIFINSSGNFMLPYSELLLSLLVLLLLIYFLIIGNGPWSLDTFIDIESKESR